VRHEHPSIGRMFNVHAVWLL